MHTYIIIDNLAVPFVFERGVMSMMPSLAWQTQVSDLPWAGGHFVPVGPAEVRGAINRRRKESRDNVIVLDIDAMIVQLR